MNARRRLPTALTALVALFALFPTLLPGTSVEGRTPVRISIGATAVCALTDDGEITCWGFDIPLVHGAPLGVYVDLSVGPTDACAISREGAAVCWGAGYQYLRNSIDSLLSRNPDADLALAGLDGQLPPERLDLVQVVVHPWRHYACARTEPGEIVCWGRPIPDSPSPDGESFVQLISTGRGFCALDSDGATTCWGEMTFDGYVSVMGSFVRIASSGSGLCGELADGSIRCRTASSRDAPGPPAEFSQLFRNVHVIGSQGCAIDSDGAMQCRQTHHMCDHLVPKEIDHCPAPELIRYQAWAIPFTVLFEGGPDLETTAGRTYTQLFGDRAACAITVEGAIDCWSDFRSGDPRQDIPERFRPQSDATETEPPDTEEERTEGPARPNS